MLALGSKVLRMPAESAGSRAGALALERVFSYGRLPGKDLLDNFKGTIASVIHFQLKPVMVTLLAKPPLRR